MGREEAKVAYYKRSVDQTNEDCTVYQTILAITLTVLPAAAVAATACSGN